jgi:hypothetical protein
MRLLSWLFPTLRTAAVATPWEDRKTRHKREADRVFARAEAERARLVALIRNAPEPSAPSGIDPHALLVVAKNIGKYNELKVVDDTIVCAVCGGNCGQCGNGAVVGLPFTSTLPHLKAYV